MIDMKIILVWKLPLFKDEQRTSYFSNILMKGSSLAYPLWFQQLLLKN